jgi:hypothetical protein
VKRSIPFWLVTAFVANGCSGVSPGLSAPQSSHEDTAGYRLPTDALPIPIRHQPNSYSCGPTSLSAVLAFWQVQYVNEANLHSPLGTTQSAGTQPWMMSNYAVGQGLDAVIRGVISDQLDGDTAAKLGSSIMDVTTDDLRRAVCEGPYHTGNCQPVTVILDLQAWGTGDGKLLDGNTHYASDYTTEWEDGHYVVLAGIDPDDSGNVYLMDPDDTDHASQKAYSQLSISDPGVGLFARWHDYFGTNPNSDHGGAPPAAQQWSHGAIFVSAGTAGTARTTFESLVPTLRLDRRKPDATSEEVATLQQNLVHTY